MTGTAQPFEREYVRKDGSRVPLLVGSAVFGESGEEGLAFVVDLTERKKAEAALERAAIPNQLSWHANRLETMGQLTASIAHEVNQPIAATVTNAQAALALATPGPARSGEVRQALDRIV